MSEVAVDFGTSNTVLARWNESLGRGETIEVPGISVRRRYRLEQGEEERFVWVIPSLIHYGERETLIGAQVLNEPGLADHVHTFRWMKTSIAARSAKPRKTPQGSKRPDDAGRDYLSTVLRYASDRVSLEDDSFVFTAPVECFEDFQDWLYRVAEQAGIRRMRVQDEPTACVFGYHGAARSSDRFVVFDFGGGTLDVACVRLDTTPGAAAGGKMAVQLGRAGEDLGGTYIDRWIGRDFERRNRLDEYATRDVGALIESRAEGVKIDLSDAVDAELQVPLTEGGRTRYLSTTYRRSCKNCERGKVGDYPRADEACVGCLLVANDFLKRVKATVKRALENALTKGMKYEAITRVLVTGGTSLVPVVRQYLEQEFDDRVVMDHPFDSVARGACSGTVMPVLQHSYALESWNPGMQQNEFDTLFAAGTEYPVVDRDAAVRWVSPAANGQASAALKVFEVSMVKRRDDGPIVDESGRFVQAKVVTDCQHICLNPRPTNVPFPADASPDQERFVARFTVDGQRRLVVTVRDLVGGVDLLKDHPVVRL